MQIGIDKIGLHTPHLYVDMNKLAVKRDVEPEKFTIGIGQEKMAIAPITQDSVTLAANAALHMLDEEERKQIDLVLFGTETGIDHSKAAAVYVHELLGLNEETRTVELKQACYSGTAAIQLAKGHIALHPDKKVLVLASDIARYGLNTAGEATQGAGAVALLISKDPRILALEEESSYVTKDIMDFWRPVYSETAYVYGKLSNEKYISFFNTVWEKYKQKTDLTLKDFEAICFHLPYTKMGLKALRTVMDEETEADRDRLLAHFQTSTIYNRKVGNIYTGSLYLSLLSLLEQAEELRSGARIGLYSYGSGAVGEFFSGILQPNYKEHLPASIHDEIFTSREEVSVEEYEAIFNDVLPTDGSTRELDTSLDPASICVAGIKDHERLYTNKSK